MVLAVRAMVLVDIRPEAQAVRAGRIGVGLELLHRLEEGAVVRPGGENTPRFAHPHRWRRHKAHDRPDRAPGANRPQCREYRAPIHRYSPTPVSKVDTNLT